MNNNFTKAQKKVDERMEVMNQELHIELVNFESRTRALITEREQEIMKKL